MTDAATWVGLAIAGTIIVLMYLMYLAILKIAEWTLTARDELRDRYSDRTWQPHWIDAGLIPAWLAIEITCLVVGVVVMLLLVWAAYDTARQFRDWWHAGSTRR